MIFIRKKKLDELIKNEVAKASKQNIFLAGGEEVAKEQGLEQPTDYQVLYDCYNQVSWVKAVVDVITRAVVSKGYLFEKVKDEAEAKNQELLEKFFGDCNPTDTFTEILEDAIRDQLVLGNGYAEIVRNAAGLPTELWTLDPTFIKIKSDKHGKILGYRSEVMGLDPVEFAENEVIHFKMPTKGSEPYGESKLTALITSIELDRYARKYNLAFFKRGAKARGLISMKNASAEQIERNEKYLERLEKKPELSRSDLLIWGDVRYNKIGASPNDIEFLELLKYVRDETLAVMGCPPSKVSIIETGNIGAGSGVSQDKTFHEETVVPLQTKIEDKINKKLIQQGFGIEDWKFKFRKRVVNEKEQAQIFQIYVDSGIMTADEARRELGYTTAALEKKLTAGQTVVESTPLIVKLENRFVSALERYLRDLKERIEKRLETIKIKSLNEHLKNESGERQIERRYVTKEFGDYVFEDHRFPVIVKQAEELDEIIDEVRKEDIEKVLNRNMLLVAGAAGALAMRRLKKPELKYKTSQDLTDSITTYNADLSTFLAKEIRDNIRAEIVEGIGKGEAPSELKARINAAMNKPAPIKVRAGFDPATGKTRAATARHLSRSSRAELIARTETNRVFNQGALDAYKESKVVSQVNIFNPDADEECLPYIAKNPWPLSEAEGILPIHHNCRCTLIPIIE